MKHLLSISILLISLNSLSQDSTLNVRIPEWARNVLENNELIDNYEIVDTINPFYFEADFTGDELIDIAFLVKGKLNNQVGVFIINQGKNKAFVLGAGKSIGMGTNVSWCNNWFVYRKKHVYNFSKKKVKISLKNPAIQLVKDENTSIIIYWEKKRYKTALMKF